MPRLPRDDRRVLSLLSVSEGPVPLVRIRRELALSPGRSFDRLAREGFVRLETHRLPLGAGTPSRPAEREASSRSDGNDVREAAPRLTPDQEAASRPLGAAIRAERFAPFLLEGVTGSGKTEVYFQALEACLAAGRSAILLVPEIALAGQLQRLLDRRFRHRSAVFHSGLTPSVRRAAFWRVRRGEARIVLGARSAVFAPVRRLGLIVLDEAHDGAYRQQEAPRYHARQAAWLRARDSEAALVLGSATPSVEVVHAAASGALERVSLPTRIAGRRLPEVRIVDMRPVLRACRRRGDPFPVVSPPLAKALGAAVEAGRQALVLLNRRGYGGRVVCLRCGEVLECSRCSVALTLHRRGLLAVCHACGLGQGPPEACPACGGEVLRARGFGTERVLEEVSRLLPGTRVERFDRDSTRVRGSRTRLLNGFRDGVIRVLVGTQMIAKGHDFPGVTVVGVIAADAGLGIPDYRAAERTFQLLTQVAGRAGRGEAPGRVFIQSLNPCHYAVSAAAAQDAAAFRRIEMEMRRRFRYPPFVRLVSLTLRGRTERGAVRAAKELARVLAAGRLPTGTELIGPAPAPRLRARGAYHWQLLLKSEPAAHPALRRSLGRLLAVPKLARTLVIHDDP